ncbi:MAG: hypothetical protein JXJ19_06825 [Elusimicrobia bacterium]|nr:hypothetical protein [Elusimicrobiota bacterium]
MAKKSDIIRKGVLTAAIVFAVMALYETTLVHVSKSLPNAPYNFSSLFNYYHPIKYYGVIKNLNPADINTITPLWTGVWGYAPTCVFLSGAVLYAFGRSCLTVNMVLHGISFCLLLVFGFLTGKAVKDRVTGYFMAVIVFLFPLTYLYNRCFSYDYPLMGITMMCVYLLIKSGFFRDRRLSVLLGISCGLGALTYYTFALFMAGPLAVGLIGALSEAKRKNYGPARNLVIFFFIIIIMAAPNYFNAERMRFFATDHLGERTGVNWYSYRNLRLFTAGLWESQLSPPFFLLFLAGLYYLIKKSKPRVILTFLSWIAVPYLTLILMPHWKTVRYMLPLMPAMAFICAFGAGEMVKRKAGAVILAALLFAGALQYAEINYIYSGRLLGINISPGSNPDDYGYFDFSRPMHCIWYDVYPDRSTGAARMLAGIKEILRQRIKERAAAGEAGYVPTVVVPSAEILYTGMPAPVNWLGELKKAVWFDNIDINLLHLDGDIPEKARRYGKADFMINTAVPVSGLADLEEPGYADKLADRLFKNRRLHRFDKKTGAETDDIETFRQYCRQLAKSISGKEEISGGVYLYRLDKHMGR